MQTKSISIGIQVNWDVNFCHDIVAGILEYARSQPHWSLRHILSIQNVKLSLQDVSQWRPDAAICGDTLEPFDGIAGRLSGPIVALESAAVRADVRIRVDHGAVASTAAQHLADRHFHSFGFFTQASFHGTERQEAFRRCVQEAGGTFSAWELSESHSAFTPEDPAARWLLSLPKPAGVFCYNDFTARNLLSLCHLCQLRVPDEVAILGADNDLVWCETAQPQLSSVIIPWRRFGYEAAHWLDRLLKGKKMPPESVVRIAPTGVAVRQSTDTLAVPDPDLARVLAYIREHACEGLTVKEILQNLPVERRWLERKSQEQLGRSPRAEIRRVQLERAGTLLSQTDLPVAEIARSVGLTRTHFLRAFAQAFGAAPGAYRKKHRLP
jgi:LacI family transcriptional regulator